LELVRSINIIFVLARVLQHTYDCAKTAIGTPYYLSPEICQEKPYNQKSDIWSLGCILYEMLTLKHAFDSNSKPNQIPVTYQLILGMKGLVLKILRGNYPPIPDAFSDDMRHLMSEMLMKDPLKRPTIRKILEQKFLTDRITKIITQTVNKHQMNKQLRMNRGNPSIPKQPNPQLPVSSVHQPAGDERDSPERKSPMRVKGRGMDEHSQKEEHDSSSHRHVTHELSSRDRERESKHSQQNIQSLHDRAIKHQKDRDEHKIDFRTNVC
jgi:NIMA (never in mitosis gene a)-related kinase 1/4/5